MCRYCLGNTAMDLLTEFSARRRLILRSLFSSSRMARVEENVWSLNPARPGQPAWTAQTFCDVMTLELFPELAGLTVFANDEEETPWRAWYATTAGLAEQLPAEMRGMRVVEYGAEAHFVFLRTQLQAAWVEQLLTLRGNVRTPVEVAAAIALKRLAEGLEQLSGRDDAAPIAAVLLEKVQGASVVDRARNELLEELVDAA